MSIPISLYCTLLFFTVVFCDNTPGPSGNSHTVEKREEQQTYPAAPTPGLSESSRAPYVEGAPVSDIGQPKTKTMEEIGNMFISIQYPGGTEKIIERPSKGPDAVALMNPGKKLDIRKTTSSSTIRPAGGTASSQSSKGQENDNYKESYLPLYICNDKDSTPVLLEPLYKSCVRGCQMQEPVQVTKIIPLSPKPFESKLEVIWLSATQMYDSCHVDILGGQHRMKSAIEYPLSHEEATRIINEIKDHVVLNQDLIHGNYPSADCSYWQDTKDQSIMTRVRKSHYNIYWAPEMSEYYLHIPTEQVNVLLWDKEFSGKTGTYRWEYTMLPHPCLLKESDSITCLGSYKQGDNLQCASAGIMFEGPYITSYDDGCKKATSKDSKGNQFIRVKEQTMSYKDAISDSNPNVQSLSAAVSHMEELICISGCSGLTWMEATNNTDTIVDTPIGIWKRTSTSGNKAIQCSTLSTGDIILLTPVCTLTGTVGLQHISSSSTTYYWDMNKLYATTERPICLDESITDVAPLMTLQENGTMTIDTFMGRVELNTLSGESRFLFYDESVQINKQRWFPNIALEQTPSDEKTNELEISIMQQLRNLSAEYKSSCQESKGPVILQTVGGAVWMLEQDIGTVWDNIQHWFWLWKVFAAMIIVWIVLYVVVLILGLIRTIFFAKTMIRVPVEYSRGNHRSKK